MKHVEIIRKRILRGQAAELMRLRGFISATDGNAEAVRRLQGEEGNQLLAEVADFLLERLGHRVEVTADQAASRTRRQIRQMRALPKGE